MVTIYFDKQLFSHLFKSQEEKYLALRKKILSHRDEFIFLYSNAHLLDLQQDTTDIKYDEMDFMQSIVDGNHIFYESPNIGVIKESPRSAFNNVAKVDDFSWLYELDLSQITEEQCDAINNIIDISIKDLRGELEFDWLKKRTPIRSKELAIDKENLISFVKLVKDNFYEDKNSYKNIRDNAVKSYNPTLITSDCENVFNEQLEAAPLRLSFIETIKAVINQFGLKSSDATIVYYVSYMLLDLLGVSKETRRKVKFRNMQTDCMHSFFGSYCDCFVSDDAGILKKSKTLYKLFNFETKIYSIDEFIKTFDEAINNNQKHVSEYFKEICTDYEKKEVIWAESLTQYTLTQLRASNIYFGYFNYMSERTSKDDTVIILHKNKRASQLLLIQEIEIVVNRLVRSFNEIGATFSLFNKEVEFSQMRTGNWNRILKLNDADIYLTNAQDPFMLYLWINVRHPVSIQS